MNYIIGIIIGLLSAVIGTKYLIIAQPPAYHIHADLALFVGGQRLDLNRTEYMHEEPCGLNEREIEPGTVLPVSEFAHFHNFDGSLIHVHKKGITYGDFFGSLNMKFSPGEFILPDGRVNTVPVKFILNGESVADIAGIEIHDLDRLLVSTGNVTESQLDTQAGQLGSRACVFSGMCERAEKPPVESCGPQVQTWQTKFKNWLLTPEFN